MKERTIFQSGPYRIVEILDTDYDFDDLCGDTYNPKWNTESSPETLERERQEFLNEVEIVGVYGYELQVWDFGIDKCWIYVDSCWGFIGQYDANSDKYNHYIVDELKSQIKKVG